MSAHTSMRVGGPAEEYYEPLDEEELIGLLRECESRGKQYFLLGNGTNVIVRDGGYPGAVISTLKALNGVEKVKDIISEHGGYEGAYTCCSEGIKPAGQHDKMENRLFISDEAPVDLVCGAGESLARVCRLAAEYGLSGLEALSGIPGTVGGAVFMNAGAYGREIASVLASVRAYNTNDKTIITLTNEECGFKYRSSIFKEILINEDGFDFNKSPTQDLQQSRFTDLKEGGFKDSLIFQSKPKEALIEDTVRGSEIGRKPLVILSAVFGLRPGDRYEIEALMAEYTRRRNEKQPVELPSAGSFFKRPAGDYAGRLIEAAGMKGARAGGAMVSEKHAGFIVNAGGATAADVLALADEVKARVFKSSGVMLEEEPLIIGV